MMHLVLSGCFLLLVNSCWLVDGNGSDVTSCNKTSACSCMADSGLIDLKPLSRTETPGLVAQGRNQIIYYYNPCTNFDMGPLKDVGAVQNKSNVFTAIGDNKLVRFEIQDGNVVLVTRKYPQESKIILKCEENADSDSFALSGEQPLDTTIFALTSRYSCPGAVAPTLSPSITNGGGLSIGSIMLIVFFSLVFAYFVFGTTCQVVVGKAEGRERMPHYGFWSGLPGLIKDGTIFIFTCGRRRAEYNNV